MQSNAPILPLTSPCERIRVVRGVDKPPRIVLHYESWVIELIHDRATRFHFKILLFPIVYHPWCSIECCYRNKPLISMAKPASLFYCSTVVPKTSSSWEPIGKSFGGWSSR